MATLHAQDTVVMWECCTDGPEGPFDPCGLLSENKGEILKQLRRERVRRPHTYLVKHVLTRCAQEEERAEVDYTN